jgi:alkylation response protein AidB-like acyl-CoA dehydrogenase
MVIKLDFEFTKEQVLIRETARKFAHEEFKKELAKRIDEKCEFPWELYKKAGQLGLLRPSLPEEYGGGGFGVLEDVIVREELTRVDSTLGQAIISGPFGAELINLYGNENQKKKYLPKVLSGDNVMFSAFTEPDHGSDITKLSTTVIKKGEKWVINGTKTFITNAPLAKFGIVLCQEPDKIPSHRYQTMFIVETDMQGIKINELKGKMGQRGSPIGEIVFDNVEVTEEQLLGKEYRGFYQALHFFIYGRLGVAANAVGMSLGAFDRALEYAKSRIQFNKPIIEFQAISHKLSKMAQMIDAARLLTYQGAWWIDNKKDADLRTLSAISSMAKSYASEVATNVIDMAIQIFGGYGYMSDFDVERYYRDARVLRIYEGTTEINDSIIIENIANGKLTL